MNPPTPAPPWPLQPVVLQSGGLRLEPLTQAHHSGLQAAAAEDAQWRTRLTWIPHPDETADYLQHALTMQAQGSRLPWAVVDATRARVLGTTSYHDIVPALHRLEIGHTWYARSAQRSHVNTVCKLLLMQHAFDTLGCAVVGWRTDADNLASRRAIARLGAREDGTLRHHARRRDGTVRDTVMFSMLAAEWPACRTQLLEKLERYSLNT